MKTHLMKNPWSSGDQVDIDGFLIAETNSHVYLERSLNIERNTNEELDRKRDSMGHIGPLKKATDQPADPKFNAHLSDSTVFAALCCAAGTGLTTSIMSRLPRTIRRALERCLLKLSRRTQHLAGILAQIFEVYPSSSPRGL
ncbi:hypothetical protein KIN20_011274 [Parelaphostrongylus tenuis]|uniref:Uncharacterized protein n=1 Tax=Parelaphostrongylus tenuis TaxID=148309 RepID=A0AAD5N003_PARTN|nr:hypothetical protein KIN20_011274 [Parelaphostrongylus tenuis]